MLFVLKCSRNTTVHTNAVQCSLVCIQFWFLFPVPQEWQQHACRYAIAQGRAGGILYKSGECGYEDALVNVRCAEAIKSRKQRYCYITCLVTWDFVDKGLWGACTIWAGKSVMRLIVIRQYYVGRKRRLSAQWLMTTKTPVMTCTSNFVLGHRQKQGGGGCWSFQCINMSAAQCTSPKLHNVNRSVERNLMFSHRDTNTITSNGMCFCRLYQQRNRQQPTWSFAT